MKIIKVFMLLSLSFLFLIGCGEADQQEILEINTSPVVEEEVYENDSGVWARDNFDLQAVGNVLEESDNIQDFEKRINTDDRFNNLDLNGDGYVDYISVREFEDRDDNQRGFSLFSKFNGNDIQEIASIIFDRDRPNRRGAKVYLDGNDQIYGNSYDYEGNWLDKSLDIAQYVFGDREERYVSPYYVDNYPDYYDEYRVVETPVYRERITKYMVNPAMTKITTPSSKIKIKSPYPGRSYNRAFAKMAKPTKEQLKFYKNKPDKAKFAKGKKDKLTDSNFDDRKSPKADKKNDDFDRGTKSLNGNKGDRKDNKPQKANKPKKVKEPKISSSKKEMKKQNNKPGKAKNNKGGKGNGKGNGKGKGKGKNKN